jgi:hypothetical protein
MGTNPVKNYAMAGGKGIPKLRRSRNGEVMICPVPGTAVVTVVANSQRGRPAEPGYFPGSITVV